MSGFGKIEVPCIKVHYLRVHNYLHKFPENLGSYSEEQEERFHQNLKILPGSMGYTYDG
jgi:hypothetical protein